MSTVHVHMKPSKLTNACILSYILSCIHAILLQCFLFNDTYQVAKMVHKMNHLQTHYITHTALL